MTDRRSMNKRSFMAPNVDKIQKRKDIALSCKKLFLKHRLSDVTISQIALQAGVGKGTIYEYFTNKEDIVFEIITILMEEGNIQKHEKLSQIDSTKEKIKVFFEFYYADEHIELRTIYKEFISISLIQPCQKVIDFQTNCHQNYHDWITQIIQNGVDKGEIIPESMHLINGIFEFGTGMFITHTITHNIENLEQEINDFIDTLFKLITKHD